jgi:hypothetical protein
MKAEGYLQTECIAEFRNQLERYGTGVIIPVPNELAVKRKDIIIKDGCSDLILVIKNRVIFCELKVGTNKQQPNQIEFQNLVTNLGYQYHIIRSLDEFRNLIQTLRETSA